MLPTVTATVQTTPRFLTVYEAAAHTLVLVTATITTMITALMTTAVTTLGLIAMTAKVSPEDCDDLGLRLPFTTDPSTSTLCHTMLRGQQRVMVSITVGPALVTLREALVLPETRVMRTPLGQTVLSKGYVDSMPLPLVI